MKPLLHAQHVSFSYPTKRALINLNLCVNPGEIVVLLGVNGAGKSTLMKLIMGSLRPTTGSLLLFGTPSTQQPRSARSRVGYAPQHPAVWDDLTCTEQLHLIGQMHGLTRPKLRKTIPHLLQSLHLQNVAHSRADTLSGGMRQRLSLAISLLHAPQLLLLDEPLAGLDPQNRSLVRDLVLAYTYTQNHSVLLSTHDMHQAHQMASRVAILHNGQLCAFDTPQNLIQRFKPTPSLSVSFPDHDAQKRALSLLQTHHSDIQATPQPNTPTLSLQSNDPQRALTQLLPFFQAHNIPTQHIHLQDSPLESIFNTLTRDAL